MKILYVEDNPGDVFLLKFILEQTGQIILQVASDGVLAVEWLENTMKEGNALPQIILLDLNLPRMNGIEVLDYLKKREQFALIHVIIFTGSINPEDRARCIAMRADDFWLKPRNLDEAIQIVKRLQKHPVFSKPQLDESHPSDAPDASSDLTMFTTR
jgi:two-component system, response regulator